MGVQDNGRSQNRVYWKKVIILCSIKRYCLSLNRLGGAFNLTPPSPSPPLPSLPIIVFSLKKPGHIHKHFLHATPRQWECTELVFCSFVSEIYKESSPNFTSNIKRISGNKLSRFSDDFRGIRSELICLNSHNIRSEIWRQCRKSLTGRSEIRKYCLYFASGINGTWRL